MNLILVSLNIIYIINIFNVRYTLMSKKDVEILKHNSDAARS